MFIKCHNEEKKILKPGPKLLDKTNIDAVENNASKPGRTIDKSNASIDELLSNKEFLSKIRFELSRNACI